MKFSIPSHQPGHARAFIPIHSLLTSSYIHIATQSAAAIQNVSLPWTVLCKFILYLRIDKKPNDSTSFGYQI